MLDPATLKAGSIYRHTMGSDSSTPLLRVCYVLTVVEGFVVYLWCGTDSEWDVKRRPLADLTYWYGCEMSSESELMNVWGRMSRFWNLGVA